jgi:hypothetical protein
VSSKDGRWTDVTGELKISHFKDQQWECGSGAM